MERPVGVGDRGREPRSKGDGKAAGGGKREDRKWDPQDGGNQKK